MLIFIRFILRLYNLYFSKDKTLALRVKQMTGFVPARLAIFKLAFSHKSNQAAKDSGQTNNERLEYLGDAVLGTVVAEYLFKKYPNADEGFLTKMRSKIVKRKSLNHIGDAMGLDLLLSEYNRTRLSPSMLGNAVEALVGAVYLEKGYQPTKRFIIQRMLKLYVDMHELETVDDNYKSQLLEYCQKNGKTIVYKLVKKYKHDRRDRFQVAVMIGNEAVATANDYNKKAAEQLASLKALEKMGVVEAQSAQAVRQSSPKSDRYTQEKHTDSSSEKPKKNTERKEVAQQIVKSTPQAEIPKPHLHKQKEAPAQPSNKQEAVAKTKTPAATKPVSVPPSQANYASPPKKLARNNTFLGRCVWHATATANASLSIIDTLVEHPNFLREQSPQLPATGSSKTDQPEVAPKKAATSTKEGKSSISRVKFPAKTRLTKRSAKAAEEKDVPKKTTLKPKRTFATRKKTLGLPLRVLTPMISDIGASLNISVGELKNPIVIDDAAPTAASSPAKPVLRKTSQSRTSTKKKLIKQAKPTPSTISTGDLRVETIEDWENTLLEVDNTSPKKASAKKTAVKPKTVRKKTASVTTTSKEH